MRLKELEAELEATRQKISEQLSMVGRSIQSIDPTLYDKERVLEQVIAMWHNEFDHEPSHSAREHWNANKAADYVVNLDLEEKAGFHYDGEELEPTTYFIIYRWAHNGDSLDDGCIDSSSITVPAAKTLQQAIKQFLQWAANSEFDREDEDGYIATYSAYVDRIVRIDGLNKVVDVGTEEINRHIERIEFVVEQEQDDER